jgi:hypothetical protein
MACTQASNALKQCTQASPSLSAALHHIRCPSFLLQSTTATACHAPQVSNVSTALASMAKSHYVKYGHREPRVYKRIPLALRCMPGPA